MTKQTPQTPLIYANLIEIMKAVPAIGKDSKNLQQGFKFRSIDAVYNHLQPVFAKHGVFSATEVLSEQYDRVETKNGGYMNFCRLKVCYKFYAVDGSSVDVVVIGEAMDSGDKAANKAMAVAHKYAITQLVMLPFVSEDPDADSHEVAKPKSHPAAYTQPKPIIEACPPEEYLINFGANKGRLLGSFTKDELNAMLLKLADFIAKNPKASVEYVETAKNIELLLAGPIKV